MKKTILITGGAGFIGSNLIASLINNHKIICVDNFLTGSEDNIVNFLNHPNFDFINSDIIDLEHLECDFIYNLACPASPVWYNRYPIETIKTCTAGMFNLVDIAIKNQARMFHASTSEVYGDPTISPQSEEYFGNVNSYGPRSCYDEGKRCAEAILYNYRNEAEFFIGRIFNTYGPNMQINDGRVISNFISQALKGEDITIYGDGQQTRSFCFVDDMIKFRVSLLSFDKGFNKPFNIGNNSEFSIKEVAEKVIFTTKSSSEIIFCDFPENDPLQRKPDITYTNKIFGWEPKVQLDEGIEISIPYFKGKI